MNWYAEGRMKVAIVQPDLNATAPADWGETALRAWLRHLRELRNIDLAIFPENFVDWSDPRAMPADAVSRAQNIHRELGGPKFVVGCRCAAATSTRAFSQIVVIAGVPGETGELFYSKRIRWGQSESTMAPGQESVVFDFGDDAHTKFVPLICADVFGGLPAREQEPERQRILRDTVTLCQTNPCAIIVVCAYAGAPLGDKWTKRLTRLSSETKATVLFCNPAGRDRQRGIDFGGGGSGVFLANGTSTRLGDFRGVIVHDTLVNPQVRGQSTDEPIPGRL
jgi:predicted amidohydrolase